MNATQAIVVFGVTHNTATAFLKKDRIALLAINALALLGAMLDFAGLVGTAGKRFRYYVKSSADSTPTYHSYWLH